MKNVAALLESPAFVPLSVGVGCDQQNFITITHKPEDIEKSLKNLLDRVKKNLQLLNYMEKQFLLLLRL